MITITPEILKAIAPASRKKQLRTDLAQWMNHWFPEFGIDTPQEIRHFLSQTAHESDSFNTLREYADGSEYENRKDLGNIHVGDGKKFPGRGPLQVTGRANYYAMGVKAGDPGMFIAQPELLETPEWAVWTSCQFWLDHGLNDAAIVADNETINTKKKGPLHPLEYITYRINGGFNHLAERKEFYKRTKQIIV
jgi:putative chitinase